jgi:hypothetical protein
MAVFTGKLYCNLCKKPFKRKNEKGTYKWVCQGYDNSQSCKRVIVEEDWLISTVGMRLFWDEQKHVDKFINEQLDHIVFESKERLVIKFKNPNIDDMKLYDGNNYYGNNIRVTEIGV